MGAFKLGKMTFGSLFKKPETVLYPIEKKPQPMGLKGHIVVDESNCILCGMCDRSCTTNCIAVDKQARTWSIDRLQCVQCGYCTTVCPKKCLSMSPDYTPPTTVRERQVFSIPEKESAVGKRASESTPKANEERSSAEQKAQVTSKPKDEQLAAIMDMMDPEKAKKVSAALGIED